MKGIWKNLCSKFIDNFEGFDNLHEGLQKETDTIINIAKGLNFEISLEDVKEVLYADSDGITNEELLEMEKKMDAKKKKMKNLLKYASQQKS